jgi:hypothetical protein
MIINVEDDSENEYLDAHVMEEDEDVEGVEKAQPGNKSSRTWKMWLPRRRQNVNTAVVSSQKQIKRVFDHE